VLRRTKIIATLGPASGDYNIIVRMLREGVDGFRINFSHGDSMEWEKYIEMIRKAEKDVGREVAVIGDLQGAGIRIGELDGLIHVRHGDEIRLVAGEKGSAREKIVAIPYPHVLYSLEEGDIVLLDDGRVKLEVDEVGVDHVVLKAIEEGVIGSRKSFAIAGKDLDLPSPTEKDEKDIEFAVKKGFDYLALSFVRGRKEIDNLRALLRELGASETGIIAKVETKSAVENIVEIIDASDAIIVARGDLGMYYALEDLPQIQRMIIVESRKRCKPCILATQLLESMITEPIPSRSEVVDVSNAVIEGVDALLLTAETAVGRHPVEAVRWLARISAKSGEQTPIVLGRVVETLSHRFAEGVARLAEMIDAYIGIYTKGGNTALRIACTRPRTKIYAASGKPGVRRKLSIVWGLTVLPIDECDYEEGLEKLLDILVKHKEIGYGDRVLLTFGLREGTEHVIKIVQVMP